MATLSNQTITEKAIQFVIMDAIEKGYTNMNELKSYMKTDVFFKAVSSYKTLIEKEF